MVSYNVWYKLSKNPPFRSTSKHTFDLVESNEKTIVALVSKGQTMNHVRGEEALS